MDDPFEQMPPPRVVEHYGSPEAALEACERLALEEEN